MIMKHPSRKTPLKNLVLVLGVTALSAGATEQTPALPWNVILITNDQQRHDALGAAGNPVIQTPNMDRLASEGVLFERNFVRDCWTGW